MTTVHSLVCLTAFGLKSLTAHSTNKWFTTSVEPIVYHHVNMGKPLTTYITNWQRVWTDVGPLVSLQTTRLGTILTAHITKKGGSFVHLTEASLGKHFTSHITHKRSMTCVDHLVSSQSGRMAKSFAADITYKGLVTDVDHFHGTSFSEIFTASIINKGSATPYGRPGISDVYPLSGISGLSFDSTLLPPLLFFYLLPLLFLSWFFFFFGLLAHFSSSFFFSENISNIVHSEVGFLVRLLCCR